MNNKKNTILELKEIWISFDRWKSFIIKDLRKKWVLKV